MRARLASWLLLLASACREPTEVTVELETDIACSDFGGVEVHVGPVGEMESRPASATTIRCTDDGRVGSLVVVPSDSNDDEIGLLVVAGLGRDASECDAPYGPGCIVARRALRFIPHTPLRISIGLRAACNGVPCEATTTCKDGKCVPAGVDSSACEDGCDDDDLSGPGSRVLDGCGDVGGLMAGAAWPAPGYCPTRLGRSPFAAPTGRTKRWSFDGGVGEPLIAPDGTVMMGSQSGEIFALDGETGELRWSQSLNAGLVYSKLLGAEHAVIFGGDDGTLASADIATGEIQWQTSDVYDTYCAPMVDGQGRIFSEIASKTLFAIDARNGAVLWEKDFSAYARALSVGPDGSVYLATDVGLDAYDPETGEVRWHADSPVLAGGQQTNPAVITPDGLALVGVENTGLAAYDTRTHAARWYAADIGWMGAAVGLDGTLFAVGAGVHALDPADGTALWSIGGDVRGPVVSADGLVLVTNLDTEELLALDPADGSTRWASDKLGFLPEWGVSLAADSTALVSGSKTLAALGP